MPPLCVGGLIAFALAAASCGGGGDTRSSAAIQACVKREVPAGAIDRAVASTAQGVTSVNYFHGGDETVMTIFETRADAIAALEAEARIGDAHDVRIENVLYSGGGVIKAAIVRCVK